RPAWLCAAAGAAGRGRSLRARRFRGARAIGSAGGRARARPRDPTRILARARHRDPRGDAQDVGARMRRRDRRGARAAHGGRTARHGRALQGDCARRSAPWRAAWIWVAFRQKPSAREQAFQGGVLATFALADPVRSARSLASFRIGGWLWSGFLLALLAFLVLYPTFMLLSGALSCTNPVVDGFDPAAVSLDNFIEVLANPNVHFALVNFRPFSEPVSAQ